MRPEPSQVIGNKNTITETPPVSVSLVLPVAVSLKRALHMGALIFITGLVCQKSPSSVLPEAFYLPIIMIIADTDNPVLQ